MRMPKVAAWMLLSVMTTAAHAVPYNKVEIAGIKITDQLATVGPKLTAKGYAKGGLLGMYSCRENYEKLIKTALSKGQTGVSDGDISCRETWIKTGSSIQIEYLLSPRGYVVDGIIYGFASGETSSSVLSQLRSKLGAPDSVTNTAAVWRVDGCGDCRGGARYDWGSSQHAVQARAGMRDIFLAEINKAIAQRLPKKNDL